MRNYCVILRFKRIKKVRTGRNWVFPMKQVLKLHVMIDYTVDNVVLLGPGRVQKRICLVQAFMVSW